MPPAKGVPMEKFVYFLIWIKFIPVIKNKEDGGWRLNIFNIQHLLLMLAILIANGFYIVMVLCQVLSQIEPPSLNEWCVITFKISCMTGVIGFPFLLGKAVCAQGAQACHPNLTIPLPTLTFLCSMVPGSMTYWPPVQMGSSWSWLMLRSLMLCLIALIAWSQGQNTSF